MSSLIILPITLVALTLSLSSFVCLFRPATFLVSDRPLPPPLLLRPSSLSFPSSLLLFFGYLHLIVPLLSTLHRDSESLDDGTFMMRRLVSPCPAGEGTMIDGVSSGCVAATRLYLESVTLDELLGSLVALTSMDAQSGICKNFMSHV